jgi:Glycosyltransferase family 87
MKNRKPFIVATAAFLFLTQVAIVLIGAGQGAKGRADFRQLYTAGYMVRTGHGAEIYDYDVSLRFQNQLVNSQDVALPFNHLAFESLIYLPLSYFNFHEAYFVFMLVNFLLLISAAWLARRHLDHLRQEWDGLPLAAFLCFLPVAITLIQGQDSIMLLLLMIGTFLALKARRVPSDLLAGLLLALTLFKFQFAIVIILLLIAWSRWMVVLSFSLGAAGLALISIAITGLSAPWVYAKSLLSMSAGLSTSHQQYIYGIDPGLMPNLRGAIYGVLHQLFPNVWMQAATAAFTLVIIIWALRRKDSFDLVVLLAVVCSYHCMIHDAIILLIPLIFDRKPALRTQTHEIALTWLSVAVFVGPTVLFLVHVPYWPLGLLLVTLLFLRSRVDSTSAMADVR